MKSAKATGACTSCQLEVASYTDYRRGLIEIPITDKNFKHFTKVNFTNFNFVYQDYLASKEDGKVILTPFVGHDKRLSLPLPFKEFQKLIEI